jgi:hypothetical protein
MGAVHDGLKTAYHAEGQQDSRRAYNHEDL